MQSSLLSRPIGRVSCVPTIKIIPSSASVIHIKGLQLFRLSHHNVRLCDKMGLQPVLPRACWQLTSDDASLPLQQLQAILPLPCRRLPRIHTIRPNAAYREGATDVTAAVRQKVSSYLDLYTPGMSWCLHCKENERLSQQPWLWEC